MEENFFSQKMAIKSDEELKAILSNKQDYQKEALSAALWELEKRGKDDYVAPAKEDMLQQTRVTQTQRLPEDNYTDDPDAPELYPKWSIWVMGIFFAPIFAGIMLAMNLKRVEKNKPLILAVALGVIPIILLMAIPMQSRGLTYLINAAATVAMVEGIWRREIGELKYRKRSTVVPFVIAVTIAALVVTAIFYM